MSMEYAYDFDSEEDLVSLFVRASFYLCCHIKAQHHNCLNFSSQIKPSVQYCFSFGLITY